MNSKTPARIALVILLMFGPVFGIMLLSRGNYPKWILMIILTVSTLFALEFLPQPSDELIWATISRTQRDKIVFAISLIISLIALNLPVQLDLPLLLYIGIAVLGVGVGTVFFYQFSSEHARKSFFKRG
jgi:hypothetical protein